MIKKHYTRGAEEKSNKMTRIKNRIFRKKKRRFCEE
jgi:hypothetical protein